ncbi:hypothetical protein [Citrobacter braakii]|uniref:hypothetical protein n=1 Tax=Citrobacter braakii TaxID=57706 RepID=UPI004038FE5C
MIKQRMEHLTDEELEDLICELEAAGFYRRQLIGLTELQERRKADNAEPIYQCEFCHHDGNGDLRWHWEDVNKDFYYQYDAGRRGLRRILYATPQPTPVIPDCWRVEAERLSELHGSSFVIFRPGEKPVCADPSKFWFGYDPAALQQDVSECETCTGTGKIDERLGGYSFSNPAAKCPDCDGSGEFFPAPQTLAQITAGFTLVPTVPNQEMTVAGGDAYVRSEEVNQYPTDAARRIWAAMLQEATKCTK